MAYRDDQDALLARNDALQQEVEQLTAEVAKLKEAVRDGVVVVKTPAWAWWAAGFAVLVTVAALITLTSESAEPEHAGPVAVPASPPPPDAAPPDAAPPTAFEQSVDAVRYIVDTTDRDLRNWLAGYPPRLPAHDLKAKLGMPMRYFEDDEVDRFLDAAPALTRYLDPPFADALTRYLDHLQRWLSRWRDIAEYLDSGAYVGDDLAKARHEDRDLRASIATFFALSNELRADVDAASAAVDERVPETTARGALLHAWDTCRAAASLVLDLPAPRLAAPAAACREALDALYAREDVDADVIEHLDQIAATVTTVTLGVPADRATLTRLSVEAARAVHAPRQRPR